ncbi:MAG: flagellar protein FlaG [Syntrophobacterales bacterium]|nr:MAG: flagellar protein FlaG [Syntrophobacterales bacterium]
MKIGSFSPTGNTIQPQETAPEKIQRERGASAFSTEAKQNEKKVAPEEILDKITAMTDNGTHSVRFEMDKDVNTLVVKIFDRDTEELVRQIPAEELLGVAKTLKDYRGLLLDQKR